MKFIYLLFLSRMGFLTRFSLHSTIFVAKLIRCQINRKGYKTRGRPI